jgi:tetratricopeptide (TPR) repeat protein
MTQKKTADKSVVAKQGADVPANLPLELIPLYIWWQANGRQFMMNAVLVLVAVAAVFGVREWRKGRVSGANRAFAQAVSVGELEDVVERYGSMKIGNAARLRLATAYYDAGRYEEALQMYDACLRKGAPDGFAEIAQVGRAHALEAAGSLDEAFAAYSAFAEANKGHFLETRARMGLARVLTLLGKKGEAKGLLEILKAEKADDPMAEMMVAALEGVVDRYEPRAARSLFDRAEEAARTLGELSAPVTPAAEAETSGVDE